MGRFRDLWSSGKNIVKANAEFDNLQRQEAMHQFENLSPEFAVPAQNRAVFDALKSRRGQATGRWLREVALQQPSLEKAPVPATRVDGFQDAVAWMDTLFKEFDDLSYEFNKTGVGSDLLVSSARPHVSEKLSNDERSYNVVKTYQGRLTTRQWSLIIRGRADSICILLLPAAMLLAFSAEQVSDQQYPPFMTLLRDDSKGAWSIDGEEIPFSAIPHLAKEIIGDLIRVSAGIMSESELFSQEKPKLGVNLAVGYRQPLQAAVVPSKEAAAPGSSNMHDACDIVDGIVDLELNRLYAHAAKLKPSSDSADSVRKQISATEDFRARMIEAFEHYTRLTRPSS